MMFFGKKPSVLIIQLLFLTVAVAQYIYKGCQVQEYGNNARQIISSSEDVIHFCISRQGDKTEIKVISYSGTEITALLPNTFPETLWPLELDFSQNPIMKFRTKSGQEITHNFNLEGVSLNGLNKTVDVRNAWSTGECSQELPYLKLSDTAREASFPIISGKELKFVIIPTVERSVSIKFVNEINLCWDEGTPGIKAQENSSDCQNLPFMSPNLLSLEHIKNTSKIKINDVLLKDNFTFKEYIRFSLKASGHPVYVIQCLKECPQLPSGKLTATGDNQTSQTGDALTTHANSSQSDGSNVTSVVLGLLLGISTIIIAALSYKIWD